MAGETIEKPPLQLHLEPADPIDVADLTGALTALARQYKKFSVEQGYVAAPGKARLLVTSVTPGSIDIGLIPDWIAANGELFAVAGAGLGVGVAKAQTILEKAAQFGEALKRLFDLFDKKKTPDDKIPESITVQDCNDVMAINRPTAEHGGTQTINIHNGSIYAPVMALTADDAIRISHRAAEVKAALEFPDHETRQRVPLVWSALPRGEAKTDGVRSPDKGLISEIDPDEKSIFFTDGFAHLKDEMLGGDENFMKKVYFVDVQVSRVEGKVVSYRVIGYHGQDSFG